MNGDHGEGFLGRSIWLRRAVVAGIFLLGLGLRLIDFDEPPLDYHPDRQLQGAVITRGIYYRLLPNADPAERERAVALAGAWGSPEPPIQETLAALTYRLAGSEHLSWARVWPIGFWMAGGILLYGLALRLTNHDGAAITLAYYLIVPHGVYLSRSFQPDALMVFLLIAAAVAFERWSRDGGVRWVVAAGALAGLTILVKGRPAPIVGGLLLGGVLAARGVRGALRDKAVWILATLAIAIPGAYYLDPRGLSAGEYFAEYSGRVSELLLEPSFYVRWALLMDDIVYLGLAALGLAGVALLQRKGRGLVLGLWAGYAVYGVMLSYPIMTHNYYSAPLIPVVGLSLAPVAAVVLGSARRNGRLWAGFALASLAGLILFRSWLTRSTLLATDYRQEPPGWIALGRALPPEGSIIGLTHDYGARVAYYGWRYVTPWPVQGDFTLYALQGRDGNLEQEQAIRERTHGYRFFLVTLFGELEEQPALQAFLSALPVAVQGDGFVLYDLESP